MFDWHCRFSAECNTHPRRNPGQPKSEAERDKDAVCVKFGNIKRAENETGEGGFSLKKDLDRITLLNFYYSRYDQDLGYGV